MKKPRFATRGLAAAFALALLLGGRPAHAYIRLSYSLGRIMNESGYVAVARVSEVDRSKNVIAYRKVRDIKGTFPDVAMRHNIGNFGEFNFDGVGTPGANLQNSARDWRDIMEWADVGKEVVVFCNPGGNQSEICMGNYWYQAWKEGGMWRMVHSEPTFALSFAGRVATLIAAVEAMHAGQEVVVPCMVPSDVKLLIERTARIHRMKVSLKIADYNPQRDFAGMGGDTGLLRPLAGMPGFTHYAALAALAPGAVGVAPADFTGDGKSDLCLFGEQRVVLMENQDGAFVEYFPAVDGNARAAAWGDCNGDGRPDLLLATAAGPRLMARAGGGFRDLSAGLPAQPYHHLMAAAWLDYDGDGRSDILLADGFRGLRLYRNLGAVTRIPTNTATALPKIFEDVSDAAGLGAGGIAGALKGDHLAVADVNGDGRPDILYSAAEGVLALNTPQGFRAAPAAGIRYRTGGVAPAFGDFNGDQRPDLFVPQARGPSRLFVNEGEGRFRDVTEGSGALAKALGQATCAVWSDFCRRGRQDLLVGCVYGPNRYFRNNGDGTFSDAGDEIGLYQSVYNTYGLCALDVNRDGVPDLVMGNAGGESAVLLGSQRRLAAAGAPGTGIGSQGAVPAGEHGNERKGSAAYASAVAR